MGTRNVCGESRGLEGRNLSGNREGDESLSLGEWRKQRPVSMPGILETSRVQNVQRKEGSLRVKVGQ